MYQDSREGWTAEEYEYYMNPDFACEELDEEYEEWLDESDGQPDEYTEWQDYMGGDDYDHGQYDEW